MTLYINTTNYSRVEFYLEGKKTFKRSYNTDPRKAHETLVLLDAFLKAAKVKNPKTEIKNIVIYKGPGSFTGLRVGASIAAALSLAWGSKVKILKNNGKPE